VTEFFSTSIIIFLEPGEILFCRAMIECFRRGLKAVDGKLLVQPALTTKPATLVFGTQGTSLAPKRPRAMGKNDRFL
jgi:hypothetical protein